MPTQPTALEFGDTDLEVIRRFLNALHDPGMKALLILEIAELYEDHGFLIESVCEAIEALPKTDFNLHLLEDVIAAAPSLAVVVHIARQCEMFPNHSLLHDELVQRCMVARFATSPASSEVSD